MSSPSTGPHPAQARAPQRPAAFFHRCSLAVVSWVLLPAAQAATLLGHWTFDEASGSVATDRSGAGLDGVLAGTAALAPGQGRVGAGGLAIQDAGGQPGGWVDMGDVLAMSPSQDFSVAQWVRLEPGEARPQHLLGRTLQVFGGYGLWVGGAGANSDGRVYLDTGGGLRTPLTTAIVNDGRWHHIALNYGIAGGTGISLYIDGVLDVSSSTGIYFGLPSSPAPFMVGGYQALGGALTGLFTGWIDDVRVYSGTLSAAEISELASPVPEPATGALMLAGGAMLTWAARRRSGVRSAD